MKNRRSFLLAGAVLPVASTILTEKTKGMATHNTGNPIGSVAVKDLIDNAQNLDAALNDRASKTWIDRLGVVRKSWWGVEQDFEDFLLSSGYQDIGDYTSGLVIAARNMVFAKGGELYRAGASLELPYTTTGDWATEGERFVAVGDAVLRSDLSMSGGSNMVGHETSTGLEIALGDGLREHEVELAKLKTQNEEGTVVTRPAFLEQYFTAFFGRGMLASEQSNVLTETAVAANGLPGDSVITLSESNYISVNSSVTIQHDNGSYGSYYVLSKSGSTLGIVPRLRYAASAGVARAERTWWNRAHPGKFYMRELAQRIAHATELDGAMPHQSRILYSNISGTNEGWINPVGGATEVHIYEASNNGDPTIRFGPSRTAYVEKFVFNQGATTPFFETQGATTCVAKVLFGIGGGGRNKIAARVIDQDFKVLASFDLPSSDDSRVLQLYTFPVDVRGANQIAVEFLCTKFDAPGYFTINNIDVFDAPGTAGRLIGKRTGNVVLLGDSWVSGDWSTSERESIAAQLAMELPDAVVVRSGVGGNNINDLLARFDGDVPQHKPDYVVVVVGTNDAYQNISPAEFTRGLSELMAKIAALGARPIVCGPPALAQIDEEFPGSPEWFFNNRAKLFSRAVFDWQHAMPIIPSGSNSNGAWEKKADGTMTCRHILRISTLAANVQGDVEWEFPQAFVSAPIVSVSVANYSENQLISTGSRNSTATRVTVSALSSAAPTGVDVACTATGRWRG